MKLKKSTRLPKESTVRFVINENGQLLGAVGTAGDMLSAKIVSIESGRKYHRAEQWLLVHTKPPCDVEIFNSREEALAEFRKA